MRAFVIHPADTVATMIEDAAPGTVAIHGAVAATIQAPQAIAVGHKIAIRPMMPNEVVIKFGIPIGLATREITPGEWVHLHNCKSSLDERSNQFDRHSGQSSDVAYE